LNHCEHELIFTYVMGGTLVQGSLRLHVCLCILIRFSQCMIAMIGGAIDDQCVECVSNDECVPYGVSHL
jgi:hypothetical protein